MIAPGPRRRPRRGRRTAIRAGALLVLLALAFLLGIAFGQALEEGPEPGGTVTSIRTLRPADLGPPPETVTVTVSTP